jgi:hypothetical protein
MKYTRLTETFPLFGGSAIRVLPVHLNLFGYVTTAFGRDHKERRTGDSPQGRLQTN